MIPCDFCSVLQTTTMRDALLLPDDKWTTMLILLHCWCPTQRLCITHGTNGFMELATTNQPIFFKSWTRLIQVQVLSLWGSLGLNCFHGASQRHKLSGNQQDLCCVWTKQVCHQHHQQHSAWQEEKHPPSLALHVTCFMLASLDVIFMLTLLFIWFTFTSGNMQFHPKSVVDHFMWKMWHSCIWSCVILTCPVVSGVSPTITATKRLQQPPVCEGFKSSFHGWWLTCICFCLGHLWQSQIKASQTASFRELSHAVFRPDWVILKKDIHQQHNCFPKWTRDTKKSHGMSNFPIIHVISFWKWIPLKKLRSSKSLGTLGTRMKKPLLSVFPHTQNCCDFLGFCVTFWLVCPATCRPWNLVLQA